MTKNHAKIKKSHHKGKGELSDAKEQIAKEAGFLYFNFKSLMSKRDKFLIIGITLAIIALIVASIYITIKPKDVVVEETNDPELVVTTPYPTIPQEISETTIMVNNRAILPPSVTVKRGASIGFFNEDSAPVTIQGYDQNSSVLNLGIIAPYDVPTVVLDQPGTYRYFNPQNPDNVAEIVVTQ